MTNQKIKQYIEFYFKEIEKTLKTDFDYENYKIKTNKKNDMYIIKSNNTNLYISKDFKMLRIELIDENNKNINNSYIYKIEEKKYDLIVMKTKYIKKEKIIFFKEDFHLSLTYDTKTYEILKIDYWTYKNIFNMETIYEKDNLNYNKKNKIKILSNKEKNKKIIKIKKDYFIIDLLENTLFYF